MHDPTFAGNAMIAYDANGKKLGEVAFTGSGIPGIDQPDSETISSNGIRHLHLQHAPKDYVAYSDLIFQPDTVQCQFLKDATGDTTLNKQFVQRTLQRIWTASNPGGTDLSVESEKGGLFVEANGRSCTWSTHT